MRVLLFLVGGTRAEKVGNHCLRVIANASSIIQQQETKKYQNLESAFFDFLTEFQISLSDGDPNYSDIRNLGTLLVLHSHLLNSNE